MVIRSWISKWTAPPDRLSSGLNGLANWSKWPDMTDHLTVVFQLATSWNLVHFMEGSTVSERNYLWRVRTIQWLHFNKANCGWSTIKNGVVIIVSMQAIYWCDMCLAIAVTRCSDCASELRETGYKFYPYSWWKQLLCVRLLSLRKFFQQCDLNYYHLTQHIVLLQWCWLYTDQTVYSSKFNHQCSRL